MTKKSKQIFTKTRDFNWIEQRKLQRKGASTSSKRATIFSTYEEQYKLQKQPFPQLGKSTVENKAELFISGLEKQFKLLAVPYKSLGYCLPKDFKLRFDLQFLKIL